jgi:hypothetical protein
MLMFGSFSLFVHGNDVLDIGLWLATWRLFLAEARPDSKRDNWRILKLVTSGPRQE